MMRGLIIACALAALAGTAAAQAKVQVLQADGRADAKIRAKIDAGVLALARAGGEQVIPGDITFTDAAAAVGCKPEEASCRDEVLGMLSVDEIVITTVSPKPGGVEVAVRRVGKGGKLREATSFVAHDKLDSPDKLGEIAPLFSARAAPAPTPTPTPVPVPIGPRPAPPATTGPQIGPAPIGPAPIGPAPPPPGTVVPPSTVTTAPNPPPEVAPSPPVTAEPRPPAIRTQPGDPYKDDRPRGRRTQAIGMIGGGAMVLVGFVFWGAAASLQDDIDNAPVGTKDQIRALQDLERKGDGYATAGNLFFLGGVVLGGVSTYYFIKAGRQRTSSARLVPTVLPGGAGIAFAIGGSP